MGRDVGDQFVSDINLAAIFDRGEIITSGPKHDKPLLDIESVT
jgi:hypothetical protein